jgi:hypothetical protein
MKKLLNISFIVFLTWIVFVIFGMLGGSLTFGNGLGDLAWLIIYLPLLAIGSILLRYIAIKNRHVFTVLLSVIFNIVTIAYTIYSLTIGRGPEFRWNGHLFIH